MRRTAQLQVPLDMIQDQFVRESLQSIVLFCNGLVAKGLDSSARLSGKTIENLDSRFVVDQQGQVMAKAFATYGSGSLQGAQGTTEVPVFFRTSIREGRLGATDDVTIVAPGRILGVIGYSQDSGLCATEKTFTDTDVDTAADTIQIIAHGYVANQEITIRRGYVLPGGGAVGTLPSPLVDDTIYYVVSPTTDKFKVSLTRGGAAVNLATAGSANTFTAGTDGPGYMKPIGQQVPGGSGTAALRRAIYFTSVANGSDRVMLVNESPLENNVYRVIIFYTDDIT